MTRRSFFLGVAAALLAGPKAIARMFRPTVTISVPEHVFRGKGYVLMPDGVYYISDIGAKPEKIRNGFV